MHGNLHLKLSEDQGVPMRRRASRAGRVVRAAEVDEAAAGAMSLATLEFSTFLMVFWSRKIPHFWLILIDFPAIFKRNPQNYYI